MDHSAETQAQKRNLCNRPRSQLCSNKYSSNTVLGPNNITCASSDFMCFIMCQIYALLLLTLDKCVSLHDQGSVNTNWHKAEHPETSEGRTCFNCIGCTITDLKVPVLQITTWKCWIRINQEIKHMLSWIKQRLEFPYSLLSVLFGTHFLGILVSFS